MARQHAQLLMEVSKSPEVAVADKNDRRRAADAARAERAELKTVIEQHQRSIEVDKTTVAQLEEQTKRKNAELGVVEKELKDLNAEIAALKEEAQLHSQVQEAPVSMMLIIFLLAFSLILIAAIWMLTLGDMPLPRTALLRWFFDARRNPGVRPPT